MNDRLKIYSLGNLAIHRGSEIITRLASRKAEALLVYLAANPRLHPREVLAEMLWDERSQSQAMANLRVVLSSLRKEVGEFVTISRESIAVNPQSDIQLDTIAFENFLAAAKDAGGALTPEGRNFFEQALALYKGTFLEGFSLREASGFDAWQRAETERLQAALVRALIDRVDECLGSGQYRLGLSFARRALALEPLMEAVQSQVVRLLATSGQREAALDQYEKYAETLQNELGVEPSQEMRSLYDRLLQGELVDPAAGAGEMIREPRAVGACPYRGLAAFREADADFFFGRDAFQEQLHETVQNRSLVTVILGSSGAGKSSLVYAGLLPRLRGLGWLAIPFRPGGLPFASLAGALLPHLEPEMSETERLVERGVLARAWRGGELDLTSVLERVIEKGRDSSRLLLVIDQFEELYTLCPEPDQQRRFLDLLLETFASPDGQSDPRPFSLLITLRADFMGLSLAHRPFADALQEGSLMLGPMNRDELKSTIEKPAEMQGVGIEAGLVGRILDDVGEEPGNLPLLEFTLTLLWEHLEQGWMTHSAYEAIGGVQGALARYAENIYAEMEEADRERLRRIMVQLVQPGQGTEDTRRIGHRDEFDQRDWSLISLLADRRLVVTGRDEAGGETVEVVHEALIQRWGRLGGWMAADRDFRNWQEGLRAALRGWEASARDSGGLLRGMPLLRAEEWLAQREQDLSPAEREYLQASLAERSARRKAETVRQERERALEQRSIRRLRVIVAVLVAASIIGITLTLAMLNQSRIARQNEALAEQNAATAQAEALARATQQALAENEADARATQQSIAESERTRAEGEALARATQQTIAETQARVSFSRELAAAAINNLGTDPELSILLALHGLSQERTEEAENALHQAIQSSSIRRTFINQETGSFYIAASPDGQYLFVSGPGGGTMWDVTMGEVLFTHQVPGEDRIDQAAFTPDGALVILPHESYNEEGDFLPSSVTILDAHTGQERLSFIAHDSAIYEIATSPNGALFATLSDDQTVKIWDLEATLAEGAGQLINTICCYESWEFLHFNPNGENFVATFEDGYALVWDLISGGEKFTIGPDIYPKAYSPDGQYLVTLSNAGLIQVWDAGTGEQLSTAESHDKTIGNDVSFNPDGSMFATSKLSGEVILWSFSPDHVQEIQTLRGHKDQVGGAVFSPDGRYLYTSSSDGTTKVWDISPYGRAEIAAIPAVIRFKITPDGKSLLTADGDGVLRLREIQTGNEVTNIQAYNDEFYFDVSPDGKLLATGGSDGLVKVWDTATWEVVQVLEAHEVQEGGFFSGVMDVSFSPDGKRLASAGIDGEIYIWDVTNWSRILNLSGHTGWAVNVKFSPDGEILASTSVTGDATVKIWNTNTGQLLQTISPDDWTQRNVGIWGVDFSSDGSRLVFGRADRVAEVWQLPAIPWQESEAAQLIIKIQSRSGFIFSTRFHPDGERIGIAGLSGVVELRDASSGSELLSLQFPEAQREIEFTPDGKRFITVGFDEIARFLALDIDELKALALSRVTRELTREECQKYLHMEACPPLP